MDLALRLRFLKRPLHVLAAFSYTARVGLVLAEGGLLRGKRLMQVCLQGLHRGNRTLKTENTACIGSQDGGVGVRLEAQRPANLLGLSGVFLRIYIEAVDIPASRDGLGDLLVLLEPQSTQGAFVGVWVEATAR